VADPIFRTSDVRWGPGKGANLTPVEVDENFWRLLERIVELELYPPQPLEIAEINVVGNQMTIVMSDMLTTFGPYTLPTAAFSWTGPFQPEHAYAANDLLTANDNLYIVVTPHESGLTFVMGPNYALLLPLPQVFDVGCFVPQQPGYGIPDGGALFSYRGTRAWYLQEDAPLSVARLDVDPAAELVVPVRKNGDAIGTITFAAGSTTGVFDITATTFALGDALKIMKPAAIDADAIDLNVTFSARIGTPA
jgi:hypothetical protein